MNLDTIKYFSGIIISLLTIIIAVLGWFVHRQTERLKIAENLLSEKKINAYSDFLNLFYDTLKQINSNKKQNFEEDRKKMLNIKKTIFLYGSDEVFKALNEWLLTCSESKDQKEMVDKMLNLLVIIRKELQHNSKIKSNDLLINIMQSKEEVDKFKNIFS